MQASAPQDAAKKLVIKRVVLPPKIARSAAPTTRELDMNKLLAAASCDGVVPLLDAFITVQSSAAATAIDAGAGTVDDSDHDDEEEEEEEGGGTAYILNMVFPQFGLSLDRVLQNGTISALHQRRWIVALMHGNSQCL